MIRVRFAALFGFLVLAASLIFGSRTSAGAGAGGLEPANHLRIAVTIVPEGIYRYDELANAHPQRSLVRHGPRASGVLAVVGAISFSSQILPIATRGGGIPGRLARVIPGDVNPTTLGRPGTADVFVTAADDIAGMTSPAQIAERLTIPQSKSFTVIEFATPAQGLASPVFRANPGFIGGGRTAGGAREFVLPNMSIPPGATVRSVGP